ncbi:hypothetical protein [Nocardioides sp. P5_C9_2]
MGQSDPPVAEVDLVDSFARLVGGEVEVVLADPGPVIADGVTVVLRGESGVRRGTLALVDDDRGRRGAVRFERSTLTDGTYAVCLEGAGDERPLGCRLLVQGARPLVLLWGAEALPSRLPTPHRRSPLGRRPVQRVRSLLGRAKGDLSRRLPGAR